jgi:uncharacterized protein (DUF697 family)
MESLTKKKRGMVGQLGGIAFGIVSLIIIIGLGMVVLTRLGDTTANCATAYTWDETTQKCLNSTGGDPTTATGTAYTAIAYGNTQIGSTGLLSWLPAIIALIIGVFFLAYFAGNKKE